MICFHWHGAISDDGVAAGRGGGQDRVKGKPDKGLETGKVHSITHLLWNKDVYGKQYANTMLTDETNKVIGKK